jgi:prophage antirepressor-like protein
MAMQYALKVFEYENRRPFRIIDRDGAPWFVLADVCRELEISNVGNAAARLDDDEKGSIRNPDATSIGGNPNLTIINESGLYSLILGSRKPEAKVFKKWVTSEVLPSIRRTGKYGAGSTPAFIRRYNANWDRVDARHFSVINELAVRLWGRFEQLGHILADKAVNGTENRPDVSVGKLFSAWLKDHHPAVCEDFTYYLHWTPDGEFPARQYPLEHLHLYLAFVDEVWIPEHAGRYLKTRDPAALPYLAGLLPAPVKRRAIR